MKQGTAPLKLRSAVQFAQHSYNVIFNPGLGFLLFTTFLCDLPIKVNDIDFNNRLTVDNIDDIVNEF